MDSMKSVLTKTILPMLIIGVVGCGSPKHPESSSPRNSPKGTVANGTESGNGTDYLPMDARSAWFVNKEKEISYCLEIAPGFDRSREDIGHLRNGLHT